MMLQFDSFFIDINVILRRYLEVLFENFIMPLSKNQKNQNFGIILTKDNVNEYLKEFKQKVKNYEIQ